MLNKKCNIQSVYAEYLHISIVHFFYTNPEYKDLYVKLKTTEMLMGIDIQIQGWTFQLTEIIANKSRKVFLSLLLRLF